LTTQYNPMELPPDLPVPADDGGADHLTGMTLPSVSLPTTGGGEADLSQLPGLTVVFAYPRTGVPGEDPLPGWNEIPGARGCTPQACGFRDHHQELVDLGARVFGLSTQTTDFQREAAERLELPYPILSDAGLRLTRALNLPTFEVAGLTLIKRLALIIRDGRIEKVFYPVFPPDKNAEEVIAWLRS
jgi:peroxiredoxin